MYDRRAARAFAIRVRAGTFRDIDMNPSDQTPRNGDRRDLLLYAREIVVRELDGRGWKSAPVPEVVGRCGGVFVTLRTDGLLRGCVGTFAVTTTLAAAVRHATLLALNDRRFVDRPLQPSELGALRIELSLLSDPERTSQPDSLTIGVHGVLIRRDGRSGCFLPQVAVERHWSAEEFLAQCCVSKAGLAAEAWRDDDTEVSLFTTNVIAEPENVICQPGQSRAREEAV